MIFQTVIQLALLASLLSVDCSLAFQQSSPVHVVGTGGGGRGRDGGDARRSSTTTFQLSQNHKGSQQIVILSSSSTNKEKDEKQKKGAAAFDEGLRTKLVSESIAPWRTLRLFLYGALGSGAAVGGFITLTGTLAALSGARTDVDLNTEYVNLAIDFGAVAVFALLAKLDVDKGAELREKVDEKIVRKKKLKGKVREMKRREKELQNLALEIQVSLDGATKIASVRDLQQGAKQHVIIVAGPKKACRDALIGANLLKMDFAMSSVLVVPYDTEAGMTQTRPSTSTSSGGFGERPSYETQPYVARASGEDWVNFIREEMKDAIEQNGESAREEGIALVVANTGNVVRRGVGTVPWRQMVEQLQSGEFE